MKLPKYKQRRSRGKEKPWVHRYFNGFADGIWFLYSAGKACRIIAWEYHNRSDSKFCSLIHFLISFLYLNLSEKNHNLWEELHYTFLVLSKACNPMPFQSSYQLKTVHVAVLGKADIKLLSHTHPTTSPVRSDLKDQVAQKISGRFQWLPTAHTD